MKVDSRIAEFEIKSRSKSRTLLLNLQLPKALSLGKDTWDVINLLGDYTLSCPNPCLQLIVACKNFRGDEDAHDCHEWRGDDLSNAVGFCTLIFNFSFIRLCLHGLCPLQHAPSSRIQNDSDVLFHGLYWKSHVILTFEINYGEIWRQKEILSSASNEFDAMSYLTAVLEVNSSW